MPAWQRYLTMPFISLLAVAVLNGPVLFVNALLPGKGVVILEGVVKEKSSASSKSNARIIFTDNNNVSYRWPVHGSTYALVQPGDNFRIKVNLGGLGILFVRSADTYWELNPKTEQK